MQELTQLANSNELTNLAELTDWISNGNWNFKQAVDRREALDTLRRKSELYELLSSLLRNDAALEAVASRSYHHKNGFDKVIIGKSYSPGYEIQLDIWWPEDYDQFGNIHNHQWDYSSCLLTGSFLFETFRTNNESDEFYAYKTISTPQEYRIELIERSGADCLFSGAFVVGMQYDFDHRVLHRIRNLVHEVTSTILIKGPPIKDASLVLTEEVLQTGAYTLETFSPALMREKLMRYLAALN